MTETACKSPKGLKNDTFVSGNLDLWLWLSTSSKRGTKHVFRVNLVQIRSAVPKIFHTQTKNQTDSAKNTTLCSSLCVVKNNTSRLIISVFTAVFQVNLVQPVPLSFFLHLFWNRNFGNKWCRFFAGQMPFLNGTENEYRSNCGDAVWLGSKGRYGSFHLWINVWVARKTVWSVVNTCHTRAL